MYKHGFVEVSGAGLSLKLVSIKINWNLFLKIFIPYEITFNIDLYRPPPPPIFENDVMTPPPPEPLEKLKFHFRRFLINSLEIVIFQ